MKTATGLALLAVGAILAAVNADLPGVNLEVAGWIIMLTGAAGRCVPARASGWLRRRVVLRAPQQRVVEEANGTRYPPQVMRDPAAMAACSWYGPGRPVRRTCTSSRSPSAIIAVSHRRRS
jgi:hypothetical protein